ncbi:glutamate-1-semialdehyde 2,1-aminomutase [Dactylosporangium sp. AC04546]|uniref:glutamate-1-semialdehyde 2,1-aminomutase n=1 Tax=Dactylosporangium sp. AC04546 TaxID=2862460 RepID=UPI001EDD8A25|nr:glutamate-1-semialdehyde 2,1-aminomutase [Dactylosporangium sp. AC04546]WVK85099.1 glutamate-1-semialdehyde 2,1-aminomutase [Dactylosporangium sp. AC04546]
MRFQESNRLRPLAHAVIPGGAHTYAKGDDQFPEEAPGFIVRGAGCHVWDVDGNEFVEYGMGLRAVTLGHAYAPVVAAAAAQLQHGLNFSRPGAIELTAAERLRSALGQGDRMVKFAKNGSDVTSAAVKLARAATGRDLVAICGDHPFFSTDDWFIGTTGMPAGIPDAIRSLTLKYRYNDLASVEALIAEHPGRIACLVQEVETTEPPAPGFLEGLRALCDRHGIVLVFDEIITGFRWHVRGASHVHGVLADLTTYGKALGNGFAVAALVGKPELMELGGLRTDRERVFLLSTTYGADTHTLAATMAVLDAYEQEPVIEHLHRQGARLAAGVRAATQAHGVAEFVDVAGRDSNLIYLTKDADGERSQPFRTLFLQELIRRGVIAPSFVMSYSHTDADIDRTIEAVDGALAVYAKALSDGVEGYLVGRPVKPVFRPYV